MVMISTTDASVRYTTVLPAKFVAELKELASRKVIPSVNYGIREAIEQFLAECKRELYHRQMTDAANDNEFMERTLETQEAFKHTDSEVGGQW
jgi:hypothetical protein